MSQRKDSSLQVAIIVGALLAIVGGGWLFLNNRAAPEPSSAIANNVNAAAEQLQTDSNPLVLIPADKALQMAEMAFQSGQLMGDEEGSAVYFYRQVLDQEPDNARALAGIDLIATQLADEASALLAKNNYQEVTTRIEELEQISPGSEYVAQLTRTLENKTAVMFEELNQAIEADEFNFAEDIANDLSKIPNADSGRISAALVTIASKRNAIEVAAAEAALKEDAIIADEDITVNNSNGTLSNTQPQVDAVVETVPEPVDYITPLLDKASARIKENRLFKPSGDSALDYFNQVLELEPTNSDAKRGLRGLVQNMTSRAYKAAKNGDWKGANESLEIAQSADIAENLIEQTRVDIKKQRVLQAKNKLVKIDQFEVEKSVAPKYPSRAISRSIEGWVKVEFTVAETGETKDLRVIESSERLAKQFGKSALAAVEQWRFKPRLIEGQAVAQRSQTTLQFKLTD